jgi:threonyl-tRNA synthetase
MLNITLPNGDIKQIENGLTIFDFAKTISSSLAKSAICGKVNGELVDTSFVVDSDCEVAIITNKDDDALEVLRHSTAHLLAQATQEVFPGAQVTIGPVIKDGFYYDFAYKDGFSEKDLAVIEKKMNALIKQNLKIERSTKLAMKRLNFSKILVKTTKLKLSSQFQATKLYLFIAKAALLTFVADHTCHQLAKSKLLNSPN